MANRNKSYDEVLASKFENLEYAQGFLFGKPDPDPWQFVTKLDRRLFGSKTS